MRSKKLNQKMTLLTLVVALGVAVYLNWEYAKSTDLALDAAEANAPVTTGVVTDALEDFEYTCVYACGAVPMLQVIDRGAKTPAQFSLEARMGCGFGACMGCTVETVDGPRRVCKDGPVFRKGEIIW